jgi:hypothetical protein
MLLTGCRSICLRACLRSSGGVADVDGMASLLRCEPELTLVPIGRSLIQGWGLPEALTEATCETRGFPRSLATLNHDVRSTSPFL